MNPVGMSGEMSLYDFVLAIYGAVLGTAVLVIQTRKIIQGTRKRQNQAPIIGAQKQSQRQKPTR